MAVPHSSEKTSSRFHQLMIQADCLDARIVQAAQWVTTEFDQYYMHTRRIPALAQAAFESRDATRSIELSRERLAAYTGSIAELGSALEEAFPALATDESLWRQLEAEYLPLIRGRYETDLALAYLHSLRRWFHRNRWAPTDYSFRDQDRVVGSHTYIVHHSWPARLPVTGDLVKRMLEVPGFQCPWRDFDADCDAVAARLNAKFESDPQASSTAREFQIINAGFFRNRGGYIVGRVTRAKHTPVPLIIALLNGEEGLYVDAVLLGEAEAHNIFSSTLANFHVSNTRYHEIVQFLHSIMPKRPLGLHYSTIGINHIGKVAVITELRSAIMSQNEVMDTAVGNRGTVAIGFTSPSCDYILKVLRDKPTKDYKWGSFGGVQSVLDKYRRVHEINRTGSMLDSIIYYGIELDASWFDQALLAELTEDAGECVSIRGEMVLFRHLIVQRRMTPLPVFLETASDEEARTVVASLGDCIKNNAAANIFNKDLDARNYGVSRLRKVYLFDYDALEPFTEVKVRSNEDHFDGEEDVPDWYYEDGVIFLPEELEPNLNLVRRDLRDYFRALHGDLFSREYWDELQAALGAGAVPSIRVYPDSERLEHAPVEGPS